MDIIREGISIENGEYVFNFKSDNEKDFIKLKEEPLNKLDFDGNVYLYGYNTDLIPFEIKNDFIKNIRYKDLSKIKSDDYNNFIKNSVIRLDKTINLSIFDLIIYPQSRSSLINDIIKQILYYGNPSLRTIELVKDSIDNIDFNRDALEFFLDDKKYNNRDKDIIRKNIDNLIKNIKTNNYFSISNSITKPKYRKFLSNFLKFRNPEEENTFRLMNDSNILIIDDITTSGTTIREITRNINRLNPQNIKVIYSFFGKEKF